MISEARTMGYLHAQGFPVPAIEEISEDGSDLVMERVQGVSMVEALARAPWTVRRLARVLAELHRDLHDVAAPDFLWQRRQRESWLAAVRGGWRTPWHRSRRRRRMVETQYRCGDLQRSRPTRTQQRR
jgi:aminoglycoside phosphotransferase